MALTEEAARVSGILYVTDAYREEAEKILLEELSGTVQEKWSFDSGHSASPIDASIHARFSSLRYRIIENRFL